MRLGRASTHLENVEELERSLVLRAGAVLAILAWLAWYRELIPRQRDYRLIGLSLAGSVLMLGPALLRTLPARWRGLIQVGTGLTITTFAYHSLGYTDAAPFFVLPTMLAAFLLSPWSAPAVALVSWVLLGGVPTMGDLWPQRALVLTVGALAALWSLSIREEIANAWKYAERSARLTHEVREQQQKVRELNKALQLSNDLLRRSLSELAAAQRETEEARRLKEQFATTVSHELRTPLNVILGFIEVMQRYPEVYGDVTWTPDLRRDISEIQTSARYLSDLVDDILDLARVQALKMPIHREHTDLASLVQEVADLASRLLMDKEDVRLRTELPSDLPEAYVDRTRIRQVLINLLANAARFTEHGQITISARLAGDEVVLSVADTGTGIPPDQLETIFDEFSQVSGYGDERLQRLGKGLGLAIAKRFVQMHGGRIWAESQLGRGSTFSFSLPLSAKQVARLGPPLLQQGRRALGAPAIVVVDTDGRGSAFLGRHLDGFEVVPAASLAETRKLVHRLHPRAVIVNSPSDAYENSQGSLFPILPEPVPVIFCSLPSSARRMEAGVFDDWLVKPVDNDKLLNALARFPSARRLLLVDDDASFAHLVRRILQAQPERYDVVCAYDGRLALEMAKQFQPDLVLLDIALPGLNGWEVARLLRQSGQADTSGDSALHIVAVTALQAEVEESQASPGIFSVTAFRGLTEEDTLHLIQACLEHLRPVYSGAEDADTGEHGFAQIAGAT